jgi:sec-independent protein translocase protein TatC
MKGVAVQMDITKYWSLALNFMLAFGLVFELPLVIVMLVQMGVTTTRTLRKARAYIVVVVFILAAVLTPSADPFNMMAMALPMWLLFESSLWVARILERKKAKAEEAEEAEERAEARANQEELEKAKAEPAEEIVVPNPE